VEIVEPVDKPGGIQQARLERLEEICAANPGCYIPRQYDNPDNPASYASVGDLLRETLGTIDCLIGAVGSGGSTGGIAKTIRQRGVALHLLGVDSHASVIFGREDGLRLLRGLGSSIFPRNVAYEAYDEIHWVAPEEVFHATRELYRNYGLFMGPTSGAAYMAGSWWAKVNRNGKAVMLFPDEGYRYQDTVYSDDWLYTNGMFSEERRGCPVLVERPSDAGATWSKINWSGRSLDSVLRA
jgi:cysteine synthase A